jgi:hypothetical protein
MDICWTQLDTGIFDSLVEQAAYRTVAERVHLKIPRNGKTDSPYDKALFRVQTTMMK